ncbi:hypothetical protein CWI75_08200 [Kineobactrum sediminis]|uniref:Core-binding (CB) domain-containing protein n=1 Tax=Kineobactrum sediminis TaxID=1905677 RepID=A0A2N5Y4P0_9GAMM|nr:hypothetical protein [Kineobactrum sediminis]PLW83365.1 hypothetical protein CWI75_08200 [Kineobactrum sediminis]
MVANDSYTLEALLSFLKQAGMEGLINPATARARRKALEHLAGELYEAERLDIRQIKVDELLSRFHKLEGSSIRPETLQIYGQRVAAALTEYLDWLENPATFTTARRERSRAFTRGGELSPEQQAAERVTLEAIENPSNVVPVRIRNDHVVYLANLPLDLKPEEADRIARVIKALAETGDAPA